ncbi:MAG: hypothetical protein L0Y60_15290 [Beijerinckiaceae bacterium]|nr:hypothetical protein [Beijerinckiaceae bacterium]
MVTFAVSRADLVIIPTQGSQLDAVEAEGPQAGTQHGEGEGRQSHPDRYPLHTHEHRYPAVHPASHRGRVLKGGVRVLDTQINERDAFRAIFSFGGTLSDLVV